jgi:hypothetical protein
LEKRNEMMSRGFDFIQKRGEMITDKENKEKEEKV